MTATGTQPWALGIVAALAAAGGVHAGLAVDHGPDAQGLAFAVAGGLQLLLAVLLARRPTPLVRHAALGVLLTPTVAWLVTRISLVGDDGVALGLGLGVTMAQLVAAAALWARPTRPIRAISTSAMAAVPLVAVLGMLLVGMVPAGHDHHHDPPASASGALADDQSIFGELFAGHDTGHDH